MGRLIFVRNSFPAIISDEDYNKAIKFNWTLSRTGYVRTNVPNGKYKQRKLTLHEWILGKQENKMIDHINGNKLDNRRENLRFCTNQQNQANQKIKTYLNKTSRFKGVSWCTQNNKWKVGIKTLGKSLHLGFYLNELEAAKAYNSKALELHGEFAAINILE